jgi:hypothetical protein
MQQVLRHQLRLLLLVLRAPPASSPAQQPHC